jgi:hypothetical protein
MRALDTPIRLAAGRTFREILLIGQGVVSVGVAISRGDHSYNVYSYAAVTLLFALRFFAGRVVYLSLCVGALALQLSCLMLSNVSFADSWPAILGILVIALLLSGPDLVRRFDDEGRGLGPWRNYWRDLSMAQRRHIAWGMHFVGATGGLLHHTWYNLEESRIAVPTWLYVGVAACSVIGFLYLWGRALAAPAAVALGGLVMWKLAPHLDAAWNLVHGRAAGEPVPIEVAYSAHYVLSGFLCAAAMAALALPWAVRWLRLPLSR